MCRPTTSEKNRFPNHNAPRYCGGSPSACSSATSDRIGDSIRPTVPQYCQSDLSRSGFGQRFETNWSNHRNPSRRANTIPRRTWLHRPLRRGRIVVDALLSSRLNRRTRQIHSSRIGPQESPFRGAIRSISAQQVAAQLDRRFRRASPRWA